MEKEELIKKYGDVELTFYSYYKYSFNYTAKVGEINFYGYFGGDSSEIYKYRVEPGRKVKVKDYENELHSLTISDGEKEIFSYYDPY